MDPNLKIKIKTVKTVKTVSLVHMQSVSGGGIRWNCDEQNCKLPPYDLDSRSSNLIYYTGFTGDAIT